MQDEFAHLLSRFDGLSDSEIERLESLALGQADRLELLAFVRKLFAAADPHAVRSVTRANLVEYVLATQYGFEAADISAESFERIRSLVETEPEVRATIDEIVARLNSLDEELPAFDHFERLTGISLKPSGRPSADASKSSSIVREPSIAPTRPARVRQSSGRFFRKRKWAILLPNAGIALVIILAGISRMTTPDAVSFIRSDLQEVSIVPLERSVGNSDFDVVEEFRERLVESVSSTVGLFPRADAQILFELDSEIRSILESENQFSPQALIDLRLIGATTAWAMGDDARALAEFESLSFGQGPVHSFASSAASTIRAELD